MAITAVSSTLPDCAAFERAGLEAWPGLEVDWDGAWVRRWANGYTKRANSLQCFDPDDGAAVDERLEAGMGWFSQRGVPGVVRTTPLESPALTLALDRRGWVTIDRSHLYAMPIGRHEADADTRVMDVRDPAFLAAQQGLQNYGDETLAKLRALLGAMQVPAAGVVVYRGNEAVASGLMAVADGIVVTGNVVTGKEHRRQGYAQAMMRTGLAWAAAQGARFAALNVQADNAGAKVFYGGLGYGHVYDYVYRVQGAA